jgi:hypothetical protein
MNSITLTIEKRIHPLAWQTLCLLTSLVIFILILNNRSPIFVRPVSMALRTGFGVVIPLAALVVYGAFRIKGRIGELTAMTAILSLFAMGLAGLWASGDTQSVVLNGMIPLTDAAGYYTDATRLQYGMDVSNFTSMRPFFAGLLSLFLRLSERNLMTAVAIFTAIAGLAGYLASREIQRTHGAEVAVFFLTLMFLYYRHHSGTTMSESLGVSVSLLGVALIWRSVSAHKEWLALLGITMIALALNVRPGAMFVLPALLLWGGWVFRGEQKFSFKFFALGNAFILLVFYANSRMIAFVNPGGIAFENFAWAFYGLASGGNSWTYVFEAHPELSLLKDSEITPTIYKLAFNLILTQPELILKGMFFYWRMFFSNTWYNAYAFVAGDNYQVNETARFGMYVLGGLGIFKWLRDRGNPYTGLALLTALGVLASVPFVPPTDAYRVRLYAATIPFFALLPGMGVAFLVEKIPAQFFKLESASPPAEYPTAALSIILIVVLIAAPIFIKTNGRLPSPPKTDCPSGFDSFFTRFDSGTAVNLHRENEIFIDWMPDFHISIFRRNIHSLPDTHLTGALSVINPGSTLLYALDLETNSEGIVALPTNQLPESGTFVQLCGFWDEPSETPYKIFHAEQVIEVAAQ